MQSDERDKNELITLCKNEYKDSTNQLSILDEFEQNYLCDRALWWYTRESFLYKILNKAFRMQNINILFLFRSFIRDMYLQLQLEQYQCESTIQVYRGQLISNDELENLKKSIGEFISINSFLSTTANHDLARFFLGDTSSPDGLQRVLFEIDINPRIVTNKPFADISAHSDFGNESEVLFMLGSIFRLIDIHYDNDQIWIIKMALCGDNEHDLKKLIEHMKNEYGNKEPDLISFGIVLGRMGKLDLADKYFHRLLNELPSNDHPELVHLYYSLGVVALNKGEYDTSLQRLQKSLEICMRTRPFDYVNIGQRHNCIGLVYRKKGDHNQALESHNNAVTLFEQAGDENHRDMAMLYNNIGTIYLEQKNYSNALTFYEKSLTIKQKHLPDDHPDLAKSYGNIGNIYCSLSNFDLALEYHKRALNIQLRSLPSQHPDIAGTYVNMSLVYEAKKEFEQALVYMQKASTILHETLSSQHPAIVEIEQNIQRISTNFK